MTLAVIGSGFGRTGTASLKRALEILDFGPCHHMEEVLANPGQVAHWQDLAAGTPMDWRQVFAGYRSQVDWPGAHVWREVSATFPAAKVIHSVRPEAAWWQSFSATIGTLLGSYADLPLPPHIRAMLDAMKILLGEAFGCPPDDETGVRAAYRQRTKDVHAALTPDRLLEFDVSQGWEPLCRFLGKPVPAEPFPRVNSTEEFWQMVRGGPAH